MAEWTVAAILPQAKIDLIEIEQYITFKLKSKKSALNQVDHILDAIDHLKTFP